MKNELKFILSMIALGAGLSTFGFTHFASKDSVTRIETKIDKILFHLIKPRPVRHRKKK